MKKGILLSILFLLIAFAGSAHATRTAVTTVTQVIISVDGGGFVNTASNLDTNGVVCSSNSRYQVDANSPGKDGQLAAALAAKIAGTEIQMDITDCSNLPPGFISPRIQNVIVK